jgi:preprotein translocase subunit SecD
MIEEEGLLTQTKKLVAAIIIFFLIIVNLGVIAFAALPLVKGFQGEATRLGLRLLPESKTPVTDADIEKAIMIIRSRIEKLSGSTPLVQRSNVPGEEIAAMIPADLDLAQVKDTIINPGRLELRLVAKDTQIPFQTKAAAEMALEKFGTIAFEILPYHEHNQSGEKAAGWIIVERKPVIRADDLTTVSASPSRYDRTRYEIDFSLTPEGAEKLGKTTSEHTGENLAIVLNNEVKSAPRIVGQINDKGQISGNFTKQEAEKLTAVLGSGELPHELQVVSEKAIPAKTQARNYLFKAGVYAFTLLLLLSGFISIVYR